MKNEELVPWGWASPRWPEHTWQAYKLTTSDWRKLWAKQEGKCAGCRRELAHPLDKQARFGLKPETDHRHVAGRACESQDVRGLLCKSCNQLLGKIQDNLKLLHGLLEYLKAHGDYYGSISTRE